MQLTRNKLFLALLLFIISFSTRLLFLDSIPDGFYRDEASVGYNAYSIITTGRDEFADKFPFIFQALEDYKLPLIVYITAPFIGLFGMNDFWVRFPTAAIGALTPLALYFLVSKLFDKKIAFVSSLSLALSPWHILFSRSVNESVISVFTFVLGFYFLLHLLEKWHWKNLILSFVFLSLSVASYRTQFVFIPLMLLTALLFLRKKPTLWNKNQKNPSLVALSAFLIFWLFTVSSAGAGRVRDIGLPNSAGVKLLLEEQIREDRGQLPVITRVFHNKFNNFLITAGRNYIGHFDLTYLFFTGDEKSSNNSTPFMGNLLFIDLPFVILGLVFLIRRKISPAKILVILWLLSAPLASSLTVDSPSALRNLISSSAWSVVIAAGIIHFLSFFNNKKKLRLSFTALIILLYSANFIFFLHQFFVHKKLNRPWYRDVGLKQAVANTLKLQGEYDRVVFAQYPDLYVFFLYYGKVEPDLILSRQENVSFKNRKREIMTLINPKYSFMENDCLLKGDENTLYVCIKDRIPQDARIIESVRLADDKPAFTFLDFRGQPDRRLPPGYSPYVDSN